MDATEHYIALLRGVNVGGKNRLAMKDLIALLTALGYADVCTYIQSGNVLFRSPKHPAVCLETEIERAIADFSGQRVTCLIRSVEELAAIQARNPFAKHDRNTQYVTFLKQPPDPEMIAQMGGESGSAPNAVSGKMDLFAIHAREVFVCCEAGYGRTKLNNTFFEKKLGLPSTTRNIKTIDNLLTLSCGISNMR